MNKWTVGSSRLVLAWIGSVAVICSCGGKVGRIGREGAASGGAAMTDVTSSGGASAAAGGAPVRGDDPVGGASGAAELDCATGPWGTMIEAAIEETKDTAGVVHPDRVHELNIYAGPLDGIGCLTHLEKLDVYCSITQADLDQLPWLKRIESLRLLSLSMLDPRPLGELSTLTSLRIDSGLSDASVLARLPRLEELSLAGAQDLASSGTIGTLRQLRSLFLFDVHKPHDQPLDPELLHALSLASLSVYSSGNIEFGGLDTSRLTELTLSGDGSNLRDLGPPAGGRGTVLFGFGLYQDYDAEVVALLCGRGWDVLASTDFGSPDYAEDVCP